VQYPRVIEMSVELETVAQDTFIDGLETPRAATGDAPRAARAHHAPRRRRRAPLRASVVAARA